jgi:putative FmdB family regulatory protein
VPTYGYRCQQCEREFDVWQKMSDKPVAECPTCGGAGKRLFFPAGIVFKGSGFYATDSRSAKSAATTSNGSTSSGESGTKESKSTKASGSGSTTGSTSSTSSGSE